MALKVLLEVFNAILLVLNKNNFKIYDVENPDFYLSKIAYNEDEDRIIFDCKED